MKNYILLSMVFFWISKGFAQKELDTLYANENQILTLFFPSPIRQAITGHSRFIFTYNREREQYFGTLQSFPGPLSNLLVVTKDGSVYSYYLKYSKELTLLNYFFTENERIGHEEGISPLIKNGDVNDKGPLDATYYGRASEYLLSLAQQSIAINRMNGIKLQLEKIVYNGPDVYLVCEFSNNSNIPFEINDFRVSIINGNKKKSASFQKLTKEIQYSHKLPRVLFSGQASRFVLVLNKFVPNSNEKISIAIREEKGNRKIDLIYSN